MTFGSNSPDSFDSDNTEPVFADRATRYSEWDDPDPQSELPSVTTSPATTGKKRRGGILREIIETALIALAIFVAVRMLVLNFRVDGSSMFPNLHDGDMLLVNRNAYESWDLYTL